MQILDDVRKLTPERQGPIVVLATLLITSLVVGLLICEVWYRIETVNHGYYMTRLTRERQQLLEDRKKLQIEATVNARTERIDQIARDSLGLESVRKDQIIEVGPRRHAKR